ncbi:hypothetical protein ACFQ80_06690 [Isoptericola sp. NPDC056578]|uniref:hypothetical protein n=1 Tax=Isoptericola sp. NPDC056578 TaxID=3345870 RepID=UPI0036A396BA
MVLTQAVPSPEFLGVDATGWAAVAAIGSLFAALATLITALVIHRATGARPRISVQLSVISDGVTFHRAAARSSSQQDKPRWPPTTGVEAITVRVENKGRTPLTASTPRFEILAPLWHKDRWWGASRRKRWEIGTYAFAGEGVVTGDRVRVEPHDYAEYLLDARPLMASPHRPPDGRDRRWHHLRVRVRVAGRRDAVARWTPLFLTPGQSQFSGSPETFRQFVRRYFMRDALFRARSKDPGSGPNTVGAGDLAASMVLFGDKEPAAAKLNAARVREVLAHHYDDAGSQTLYFFIALRDGGFLTDDEYQAATGDVPGNPPVVADDDGTGSEPSGPGERTDPSL